MATAQSTIDFILEHAALPGLSARKMFGEYGLFLDGVMVALVCDNRMFVKATEPGLVILGKHETGIPYPSAKPLPVLSAAQIKKKGLLNALLTATRQALPLPKKRVKKRVTSRKA
jgi:TfoX/Sxy family transcriptional regulator of competence genes